MTGLGIAGFVISIVALLWNIGLTFVRWPRVSVVIRQRVATTVVVGGTSTQTESLRLVVINRGAEALTVGSIGLVTPDNTTNLDYESQERENLPLPEGPTLPARVEGHGCLVWEFDETLLQVFPRQAELIGYADRFAPFRKWPRRKRSSTKRTRTVVSTTRHGGLPDNTTAPTPSS
ncbi:hypothetical protein R4172_11025 [Rhodococcus kroppenstedtii]|uniref:hypothetical protein n=1 Tax=Rhodococcoides kroppenstedtii TaxID=293050 RepID=UPI002954F0BF|nr:hypothetical protein [Rhodococcus kroppenstedtii]MDV7198096.1 hypothetical protein [Rhodococcus kroppenstedtii]